MTMRYYVVCDEKLIQDCRLSLELAIQYTVGFQNKECVVLKNIHIPLTEGFLFYAPSPQVIPV